jgi:hypothetical protein
MIRSGASRVSRRNAAASASASIPCTRSSVERSTRDTSEVMMMVTMKEGRDPLVAER